VSSVDRSDGLETYEIRIRGLLGPVLLSALPHAAVSLEPQHSVVLTADVGSDLSHVLRLVQCLVDRGVEVDSIRRTSPPDLPERVG
jgi:hypothetical protein